MTALTNGNVLDISYDLSLIFNVLDVNQKNHLHHPGFSRDG